MQLPPRWEWRKRQHATPNLTSLLTKNTSWPQRIELCLHYHTLPLPPSRVSRPSLPVLAEDSLFFTVYPPPAARLCLFLWAEMKASGSDVYIWLGGGPLWAGQDKTTLPSSLCPPYSPPPALHLSIHPLILFSNPPVLPLLLKSGQFNSIKYSLWMYISNNKYLSINKENKLSTFFFFSLSVSACFEKTFATCLQTIS